MKLTAHIPQTGFYFDAGTAEKPKHDYYLDGKRMTGVTTILGVLNKPALVPWAARTAVDYIKENAKRADDNKDIYGEKTVYVDGLAQGTYCISEEKLEEAKTAYAKKRDEGAEKGTDTHALVETYIQYEINYSKGFPTLLSLDTVDLTPIKPFMEWATKENIKFLGSEVQMYSKDLFVAGTADFVFEKDGKTYIGDIKTYKKIWDRTPFYQCAGYALMWEEMNGSHGWHASNRIDPKIAGYVIFNLPKEREHNPEEDVLWSFDTEGDTKAFLACVELYRQNARFIKPSYKSKK